MTTDTKSEQVMVRCSNGERAMLDRLVDELEAGSPAEVVRGLLRACAITQAAREALPMLLRHGQRAEQEAADRRAALADPGRWTAPIAAGTRWPDDPGVNWTLSGSIRPFRRFRRAMSDPA